MPSTTTTVTLPAPIQGGGRSYSKYVQTDSDTSALSVVANVTSASNTTPIAVAPGFLSGQVTIAGVTGNTGANGTWNVTSGGNVVNASGATPIVITTDVPHSLPNGLSGVTIAGVGVAPYGSGSTAANGSWTITVLSATTFSLNGSTGTGVAGTAGSYSLPAMLLLGSVGSGAYVSGGTISRLVVNGHIQSAGLVSDSGT